MKLTPHHRIRIPNHLAMLAAMLLLVSSAIGIEAGREMQPSSLETTLSVNTDNGKNQVTNDSAEPRRRGLNLGLLLFRR